MHSYNTTLASALDRHAPLVTRSNPVRPLVPWFNNDIKEARKERRKAERRWRRTGLLSDLRRYKDLRNKTNYLMTEARRAFYRELIDANCGDQKRLFSVTKRLLGSGRERGHAHTFRCPLVSCLCACAVEQLACAHPQDLFASAI